MLNNKNIYTYTYFECLAPSSGRGWHWLAEVLPPVLWLADGSEEWLWLVVLASGATWLAHVLLACVNDERKSLAESAHHQNNLTLNSLSAFH